MNRETKVSIIIIIITVILSLFTIVISKSNEYKPKSFKESNFDIKKGDFLYCKKTEGEVKQFAYIEFKDGKSISPAQMKITAVIPDDYFKSNTKKDAENDLLYFCQDSEEATCGNVQYFWDGNEITMTFALAIPNENVGITKEDMINLMIEENECTTVDEAYIYGEKIDSKGTYISN